MDLIWNGEIHAKVIPHGQQKYNTCGDWRFDEYGSLQVRISDLGDPKKNWCVMVHEMQETMLCYFDGVTQDVVDKFDIPFSKDPDKVDLEPGDDPSAPYGNQHCIATSVERMNVALLGLNWTEYEASMDDVMK